MEITQKKSSNIITFTFKDDYLNYAYEDKTGSDDADINYADLSKKSSIRIEQNEWLKNVGYLWILIGLLAMIVLYLNDSPFIGKSFWVVLGTICIVWANFTKVIYTGFKTDCGGVYIIQDKKHDTIVEELKLRRKKQLLDWYGEIHPDNTLEQEIRKFKWLAEEEVISKEEAEKKISQVQLMFNKNSDSTEDRIN